MEAEKKTMIVKILINKQLEVSKLDKFRLNEGAWKNLLHSERIGVAHVESAENIAKSLPGLFQDFVARQTEQEQQLIHLLTTS